MYSHFAAFRGSSFQLWSFFGFYYGYANWKQPVGLRNWRPHHLRDQASTMVQLSELHQGSAMISSRSVPVALMFWTLTLFSLRCPSRPQQSLCSGACKKKQAKYATQTWGDECVMAEKWTRKGKWWYRIKPGRRKKVIFYSGGGVAMTASRKVSHRLVCNTLSLLLT